MEKQQFTGKTLDDALAQAAKAFGTEKTFISYDVLPAAKSGGIFSKLFSRGVRVEAWVEAREDDLQAQAREAVRAAIHQANAPAAGKGGRDARDARETRGDNAARDARGESALRQGKSEEAPREGRGREPRAENAAREARVENPARGPQNDRTNSGDRKNADDRGPKPVRAERTERTERGEPNDRGANAARGERGERKRPQTPRTAGEERPKNSGRENPAPRSERPPGLDFNAPGAFEALESFTHAFAKAFDVPDAAVKITKQEGGDASVQFDDEFLEGLLAKTDRLALAFEHVFKRIAQKQFGDISSRVFVNAGKAEELRAEKLREMAFGLAEKLKSTGKTITLGAKSPQERRVIHLTLDSVEGVATRSIGTGENRKLVIYSTERNAGAEGEGRGSRGGRNRRRGGGGGGGGQGAGTPQGGASGRSGGGRGPAPAGGVAARGAAAQAAQGESGVAARAPDAPQGGPAGESQGGRRRRSRRRGGGGRGRGAGSAQEPGSGASGEGGSNGASASVERAVDAD